MSHHLRFQSQPWATHHVTSRCIQGFHLLRPTPEVVATITGVLAYSLHKHKDTIKLHHYAFLSNHFHLLLSSKRTRDLARFMGHLKGNLARELGRIHHWHDTFWQKRYFSEEILDIASYEELIKYITQNSVKERLVDHPSEWTGLHGYHQMVEKREVKGRWLDRTALYRARYRAQRRDRSAESVAESDFTTEHLITLDPPPMWEGEYALGDSYDARCVELCDEAIEEALAKREDPAMGMPQVLSEPVYRTRPAKRRPRSLCRCACIDRLKSFKEAYCNFKASFQEASAKLRVSIERGISPIRVTFPEGGVPLFGGGG